MDTCLAYWARQDDLPLAKLAGILALCKLIKEDVNYDNYLEHKQSYVGLFVKLLKKYIVEYADDANVINNNVRLSTRINLKLFVEWAHKTKIFNIPVEFLELIGIKDYEGSVDIWLKNKFRVQGIALYLRSQKANLSGKEIWKIAREIIVKNEEETYALKTMLNWISDIGTEDISRKRGRKKVIK